MNNYMRGWSFEHTIRQLFERLGYTVVRAAGSHGEADLIAVRRGAANVMIQCKAVRAIPSRVKTELAKLRDLVEKTGGIGLLAIRPPVPGSRLLPDYADRRFAFFCAAGPQGGSRRLFANLKKNRAKSPAKAKGALTEND